jgi:hypothetical protein
MEAQYAIFRGKHSENPRWLGSIGGFDRAVEMMHRMAERLPGDYFVFSSVTQSVVATCEATTQPQPALHTPENRVKITQLNAGRDLRSPMSIPKESFGTRNSWFDIFRGHYLEKDAIWLEAVQGLASARDRMRQIAAHNPGPYFVYCCGDQLVLGIENTEKSLARRASAKHATAGAA